MTFPSRSRTPRTGNAFTLVELLIVLCIISMMVTVTIPYATRSTEDRKLEQACRDVAETVKYAISHAIATNQPTRLIIHCAEGSYVVEAAARVNTLDFEPLEDSRLGTRCLGPGVRITGNEGFSLVKKNCYGLVFDPGRPWPRARLSLAGKEATMTIWIMGKVVDIADRSD